MTQETEMPNEIYLTNDSLNKSIPEWGCQEDGDAPYIRRAVSKEEAQSAYEEYKNGKTFSPDFFETIRKLLEAHK